jgi:hypothetical protein
MERNDKSWLRQHLPECTPHQMYRFIEGVGKRLEHNASPTAQQTQEAREASYRDLMGSWV